MSRQHIELDQPAETARPSRGALARGWTLRFVERALGECFAPSLPIALLTLVTVAVLLAVIAYTLSIGNALLVVAAAVAMRVTCERRGRAASGRRAGGPA